MRFDRPEFRGRDAGPRERGAGHFLLGATVGGRDAAREPVLVDGGAADQRNDPVAVAACVGQALEHDHPRALGADVAVGRGVEGLAVALGREHPRLGERDRGVGCEDHVDAAGKGDVALVREQALGREVDRDQRGRARGVERQAGAAQVVEERDAVGGDAVGDARAVVGVDDRTVDRVGLLQAAEVEAADADEDARGRSGQALGGESGVLEGLLGHLQQQPLLGIHSRRLAGRDPEELRVELVDVLEEAAVAAHHLARGRRVRVVELVEREPARGRLGDGVAARAQQRTERVEVACLREAHAEPDDRDGLLGRGEELVHLVRGTRGQVLRQANHRRVFPRERRGQGPAEPRGELAGEGRRLHAAQAEGGERRLAIDGLRVDVEPLREVGGDPRFDLARRAVLHGDRRRGRRRGLLDRFVLDHRRLEQSAIAPVGDAGQLAGGQPRADGDALGLAAGRPRQPPLAHQQHARRAQLVFFGDGAPDGREHLVRAGLRRAPDLGDDREPLLAAHGGRDGRDAAAPDRGMALLHRPLEVDRVIVPAADDQHLLEPAGHEELAIRHEPEVAGAQERLRLAGQPGAQDATRIGRSAPVAAHHRVARDPDLADPARGDRNRRRGIHDPHVEAVRDAPVADEGPRGSAGGSGVGGPDLTATERVGVERPHRSAREGRVGGHEERFREAVGRQERGSPEPGRRERLREPVEAVGPDRLRAVRGNPPAGEVEPGAILGPRALDGHLVAEVGAAADRPADP